MSIEENKAVAGRWLAEFRGKDFNPAIIDEFAAPGIRFAYSLAAPLCGREELRALAGNLRASFPDLSFWATAELIAEGDYVLGHGNIRVAARFPGQPTRRPIAASMDQGLVPE